MKILVDAMGGDNAPLEIIKGCKLALDEFDIERIILLGKKDIIEKCISDNYLQDSRFDIVNCSEVIDNCDDAKTVLKGKTDSSMSKGFELLNENVGDAFVSAGNTGAITVGATLITKRIKGVRRPAIASVMPSSANPFLLMDCGANAECKSEYLYQFGLLGSIYMKNVMGVDNPRVALANNGSEETKGIPTVKEAHQLMKDADYNFIGNIEGRRIPYGDADVVVADGFTGNLILKTYEGVAKVLMQGIKDAFYKNTLSKISYLGVRSGINDMKTQFDYKEYGGAVMLGVKKPVIKAHGSADARTFKNAIKQAVWFLQTDLIEKIEKELAKD